MKLIEFMGKPLTYWENLRATVESHGLTGAYERIAELKRENEKLRESADILDAMRESVLVNLKEEQETGTLFGRPIIYVDGLAGNDDFKLTLGGPLVQTEVEELRERIALALDGIDNGYSTDYVRNVLRDTPK